MLQLRVTCICSVRVKRPLLKGFWEYFPSGWKERSHKACCLVSLLTCALFLTSDSHHVSVWLHKLCQPSRSQEVISLRIKTTTNLLIVSSFLCLKATESAWRCIRNQWRDVSGSQGWWLKNLWHELLHNLVKLGNLKNAEIPRRQWVSAVRFWG